MDNHLLSQELSIPAGPESPLISSHAALPVNSYGYGILLGREINRKCKRGGCLGVEVEEWRMFYSRVNFVFA